MEIKGITIHNTHRDDSAEVIYQEMLKQKRYNLCHYLVDESNVIQTLPVDTEASHTGKGYDFGNRFTIAIEICRSTCVDELYLKAEKNAVKLIKKLMKKYKLTKEDIYFHNDFDVQSTCPHKIMEIYKKKEVFLNEYFV